MNLSEALRVRPHLLWRIDARRPRPGDVTIVLCISRLVYLKQFFEAFEKLELPNEHTHLLMFLNCDNPLIENDLRLRMDRYSRAFSSLECWKARRKADSSLIFGKQPPFDRSKLPVIYAMHRDICELVKTERFVMFEDDTLMPSNAAVNLLRILKRYRKCGIATGIETCRALFRQTPVRLGVHYMRRIGNRIVERISLPPHPRGVVPVDACGWYCVASYTSVWKAALLEMMPYLRLVPRFGLDNLHTNNVKRKGFDILADFSVWCRHLQATGGRILEWGKEHAVPMADVWLPKFYTYAEGVHIEWEEKFTPKKK